MAQRHVPKLWRPARRHRLALACFASLAALPDAAAQSEVITITARPLPSISGFGDSSEARSPLSSSHLGGERLADLGARSLAELARIDAAATDAYNSEGYWSALSVRGFVLDPRYNYRRDGLPINAETWLPLGNKERVELLKGTSGIQAGTSAPGGLANLVVKRPTRSQREALIEWRQDGTLGAAADIAERFGAEGRVGARFNVGAERLRPATHALDGRSHWLALAVDARPTSDTLLEAEFEQSHRSQPSTPGFSLLGDQIPDPKWIDPRTNINNQSWSLPVVFDARTGSLRWRQRLAGGWQLVAHGAIQELRSDDRVAFPFGCFDANSAIYYTDRYCPDGSLDLYDYRSENERRRLAAWDLRLEGAAAWAGLAHRLSLGLSGSRGRDRFQRQAFNAAGPGSINADVAATADPTQSTESTNRDERNLEAYLRDRIQLAPAWQLWGGLRASHLRRDSVRTDGSQATSYAQSLVVPWLALAHQIDEATMLYASAGAGVESEVVPNRSRYSNAGIALPALKSRQFEAGIKHAGASLHGSLVAFQILRPQAVDRCDPVTGTPCIRSAGPQARHSGAELNAGWRNAAWSLEGGAQWLHARLEGMRPANVPARTARLLGSVDLGPLALLATAAYEGPRRVVPGESPELPGWTRWDLAARWRIALSAATLNVRIGIDNATDKRAWRESPYQFGHSYLFPLAPRTWRASLSGSF